MNTHEFEAKYILRRYGIQIPEFWVVSSKDEAAKIVKEHNLSEAVVKIQVHAGGRGKAGGVKFAKSSDEIVKVADDLLGMKMVNNQTGPAGVIAHKVILTKPVDIAKEFYLGAIIDRENAVPILIASPEGGMEIEEVAAKTPEKILKLPIRLSGELKGYELMRIAKFMGWEGESAKQGMKLAKNLAKAFLETDASLLEINPLVQTPEGEIFALDAKLSVDENALYRQQEIAAYFDPTQVSECEQEANEHDLAYIALDGEIGCMVNGAGLAMATMDIINHYGAKPANFLDVGGSATKDKVAAGFRIILSDPNVKAILVNIFGGIMNCATIAEGIIAAIYEDDVKVPLVVRLEGTNVEEGKRLLEESNLSVIAADNLGSAAKKVVEACNGNLG